MTQSLELSPDKALAILDIRGLPDPLAAALDALALGVLPLTIITATPERLRDALPPGLRLHTQQRQPGAWIVDIFPA